LLRDAARQWPDHAAIETSQETISYRELDELSNRLATVLVSRGCKRGDRVAILCEKSIDSYIGIYGILKAGCVYVPLDRRAPVSRLSYIVRDCSIKAILISAATAKKANQIAAETVDVEFFVSRTATVQGITEAPLLSFQSSAGSDPGAPVPGIIDTDLAYILYTSGSTGAPKGVTISHLNSMSFVRWASEYAQVCMSDRVSGHAPLHFDLSIFDIFATASRGATLLPVPDGISVFPARLSDWVKNNRISIWYSVPSALTMMAQQSNFATATYGDLRLIIFAGEVFPVKFLRMWVEKLPSVRFDNWYGPTETNVITAYTLQGDETLEKPLPIGSACENVDIFLADENGQPLGPDQHEGELCARGSFVALRYWGDAEKTARSFTFNELPHERTYRTGDLVKVCSDGVYEYVGRRDHMVKSRGYRIELGEIESALYKFDGVTEAVVIPVADETIGNRLLACVALDKIGDREQTAHEILAFLSSRLPSYMIPESAKIVDELPKTSTGKINRQLLLQKLNVTN